MAMTMPVKAVSRAAEAVMNGAAMTSPVRARDRLGAGAARPRRHQSHGDSADRCTPHQCQHDTARAFHGRWLLGRWLLDRLRSIRTILIKSDKANAVISRRTCAMSSFAAGAAETVAGRAETATRHAAGGGL